MIRSLLCLICISASIFLLSSCTSVDTQDEDVMMTLEEDLGGGMDDVAGDSIEAELGESEDFVFEDPMLEGMDEGAVLEEPAADEFAESDDLVSGDEFAMDDMAGGDDFAEGDFSEEDFSDADFGAADFSEEEFSEESFGEEAFAEDAFAEGGFEEPAFEEPIAQQQPPSAETFEEPVVPPPAIMDDPAMAFTEESPDAGGGFQDAGFGGSAEISDIKYLSNEAGGTVVIEGTAPLNYQTRFTDNNQFVIEVPNATLPERLKRPYIMKEFDGRFAAINAYQNPGSSTARIVVQLRGEGASQPLVQAEGNSIVVIPSGGPVGTVVSNEGEAAGEAPPASSKEWEESFDTVAAARDEKILGARTLNEFLTGNNRFYGRPISIQVKDADIRDVLNFLAEESGVNLVVSDDVQGKVSLKLRKVPWDQALVTVMRAKKLGYLRQGGVIRISSLTLLQEETDSAKKILDSQKAVTPLKVKVIPVSFARVEDLTKQLTSFLTKDRGSVVADIRTSSLIVTDTDEVIRKISRLVKELDIPPAQVMMEAKIVEAGEEFQQTVGINWEFGNSPIELSGTGGANGGPINLTPRFNVQPLTADVIQGATGVAGFQIGTLDVLGDLDAALSLAEKDSLIKIISSPRIVTINKEKAQITQVGQQVTISTVVDQSGTVTRGITRTPIVMDLTVTPQITADGSVIMDLEVKREFAGGLLDAATQARAINSRTAKTKILVKNGQTAVIGGIYQSDATESETGVPLLKDIPVLGWLFKSRTKDRQKNELLIFLTPRVLNIQDQTGEAAG